MAKYDPLEKFLRGQHAKGRTEWNTSFKHIENVLGFRLPNSARIHPEWWANENLSYTTKSQCKAWAISGWKTANVNIVGETVTFIFQINRNISKHYQISARQGLKLEFSWKKLGNIFLDHKHRLKFPDVGDDTAVYKLNIQTKDSLQIYVGETDNLRRRLQGYRTPGPTQPTNKRLKQIMDHAILAKRNVSIETMSLVKNKNTQKYNFLGFDDKFIRRVYENAAIILIIQSDIISLNL